jgi:hypothetical protein
VEAMYSNGNIHGDATGTRISSLRQPITILYQLELIAHIPHVPWCTKSATDGFIPGEIRSSKHAQ